MKLRTNILLATLFTIALLFTQCQKTPDEIIKNEANNINKQCPVKVDAITILDSCIAEPNITLKYVYSLHTTEEITLEQILEFENNQKEILRTGLKRQANSLKTLFDINTTFVYTYRYPSGKLISEIQIKPEQYKD